LVPIILPGRPNNQPVQPTKRHFRCRPPGSHHPGGSSEQPTSPKPTNRLHTSGVSHLVPCYASCRVVRTTNQSKPNQSNQQTDFVHFRCGPPGASHPGGSSEQPTSPKPTNRLCTSGVSHLVPCYTSRRVVRTTNQSKPNKPSSALPVGTTWCHATTNVNAKRDRQTRPERGVQGRAIGESTGAWRTCQKASRARVDLCNTAKGEAHARGKRLQPRDEW
jgi:hypothetical protein